MQHPTRHRVIKRSTAAVGRSPSLSLLVVGTVYTLAHRSRGTAASRARSLQASSLGAPPTPIPIPVPSSPRLPALWSSPQHLRDQARQQAPCGTNCCLGASSNRRSVVLTGLELRVYETSPISRRTEARRRSSEAWGPFSIRVIGLTGRSGGPRWCLRGDGSVGIVLVEYGVANDSEHPLRQTHKERGRARARESHAVANLYPGGTSASRCCWYWCYCWCCCLLRAHGGGRTRWGAAGLRQGGEEACLCFVPLPAVSAELACPGHASRFQGGRRVSAPPQRCAGLVSHKGQTGNTERDAAAGVAGASHRLAAQFCGRGDAPGPDTAGAHAFSTGHGRALWHESGLLGTAANRSEVAG